MEDMTPAQQAAAFHGLATNRSMPAVERLTTALQALHLYEKLLEETTVERDALLAELDGRTDEARERWIAAQLEQTSIRSMEIRAGRFNLDLETAREVTAEWVAVARAMLGDAPNYAETRVDFTVKVAESPERYVVTFQRAEKPTPHELRQRAEAERDEATARVERVLEALDQARDERAAVCDVISAALHPVMRGADGRTLADDVALLVRQRDDAQAFAHRPRSVELHIEPEPPRVVVVRDPRMPA